ncbi:UNVERIFIED_CONTAM: hypothetical protein FKN15_018812 [Acipenser sinensis]
MLNITFVSHIPGVMTLAVVLFRSLINKKNPLHIEMSFPGQTTQPIIECVYMNIRIPIFFVKLSFRKTNSQVC